MASLFTKIIRGEIPCHKLLEDDHFFAFLDVRPINPGHTLVVPKQETDYLFELDSHLLSGILPFSQKLIPAIEQVVPCKRVGLLVAGLEIPHAHIHLVPLIAEGDLTFERAQPADSETLKKLATQIRTKLNEPPTSP